jgi:hypothetical protein
LELLQVEDQVFVANFFSVHLLVSRVHLFGKFLAAAMVSFVNASHCSIVIKAHILEVADIEVLSGNV